MLARGVIGGDTAESGSARSAASARAARRTRARFRAVRHCGSSRPVSSRARRLHPNPVFAAAGARSVDIRCRRTLGFNRAGDCRPRPGPVRATGLSPRRVDLMLERRDRWTPKLQRDSGDSVDAAASSVSSGVEVLVSVVGVGTTIGSKRVGATRWPATCTNALPAALPARGCAGRNLPSRACGAVRRASPAARRTRPRPHGPCRSRQRRAAIRPRGSRRPSRGCRPCVRRPSTCAAGASVP